MGLFSFNYAKPGPGVEKDAPKKKGIFLYFELLGRKFFKLCQVNMLYFLCSIPYLVLMFLLITGMFGSNFGKIMDLLAVEGASDETVSTVMLMLSSCITMLVYALWGSGPASASFAYVTRCFTREEHSWILSDFFKIFKENFKQGMIMVVVDFVAFFLMLNAIVMYWNMYVQNNQFMYMLLAYFCVMMFIIYTFMHFHIYQLMVTFKCTFRQLLKNALMLAFGKAPMNLLLAVISGGLVFVLFNFPLNPVFAIFVCFLVYLGLVRYPLEFYSARTIQRVAVELREDKE